MKLTEEERRILNPESVYTYQDDPNGTMVSLVASNLADLFYVGTNDYPTLEPSCEAARRLLIELYIKRTWDVPDQDTTFETEDIFPESFLEDELIKEYLSFLPNDILDGFDVKMFDSPQALMEFVKTACSRLNVSQMEYFKKLIFDICDQIRMFMKGYIPTIFTSLRDLDNELELHETSTQVPPNARRNN